LLRQHLGVLLTGRLHRACTGGIPDQSAATKKAARPDSMRSSNGARPSIARTARNLRHRARLTQGKRRCTQSKRKTGRKEADTTAAPEKWPYSTRELRRRNQGHSVNPNTADS
jgi:hypothetical protein